MCLTSTCSSLANLVTEMYHKKRLWHEDMWQFRQCNGSHIGLIFCPFCHDHGNSQWPCKETATEPWSMICWNLSPDGWTTCHGTGRVQTYGVLGGPESNQQYLDLPNLHFYSFFDVYMGVSKNSGTPKSSILIGFALINHPFWGTTILGNPHICVYSICIPMHTTLRIQFRPWEIGGDWRFQSHPENAREPSFTKSSCKCCKFNHGF